MSSQALADLHLHTHHSDGTYTAEEAVQLAKKLGLRAIAICDHDSVGALEPARAEGERTGVEVIPGVELSTQFNGKDVHILGYFFDPARPAMRDHLVRFRDSRTERGKKMVEALRGLGLDVTFEDVLAEARGGAIGRPHVADALIRKGLVENYNEVFGRYIGFGRPAYVEKFKISVPEVVALVEDAGGITVLAHPGIYVGEESIRRMAREGIRGLEVEHPKHTPTQVRHFTRLADELGLVPTGGSDCHGSRNGPPTIGSVMIPYENVLRLRAAASKS